MSSAITSIPKTSTVAPSRLPNSSKTGGAPASIRKRPTSNETLGKADLSKLSKVAPKLELASIQTSNLPSSKQLFTRSFPYLSKLAQSFSEAERLIKNA